jgi:hypothetical protein
LGLGNPECKLQVSKSWGSHVLKIMSLKIPCLGFGEPPIASKLQVTKNWDN